MLFEISAVIKKLRLVMIFLSGLPTNLGSANATSIKAQITHMLTNCNKLLLSTLVPFFGRTPETSLNLSNDGNFKEVALYFCGGKSNHTISGTGNNQ
ncbi:hypothetical protein D3C78_1450370 [compost metagenome]